MNKVKYREMTKERQQEQEENKSGQLTPAEASMSALASCQRTDGRVCYGSVAVICLSEVHSKLVQAAQPVAAS